MDHELDAIEQAREDRHYDEARAGVVNLEAYVEHHRERLEAYVRAAVPNVGELDLDDLCDWVSNDETLYREAQDAGVV
jgi:hypothetical protein